MAPTEEKGENGALSQPGTGWRVRAVVNANAGGSIDHGALVKTLESACRSRGWDVKAEVVEASALGEALDRAMAERPGALVVGGGDGSIRGALSRVLGTETALGVLPMGTMNFVAKDLGIPLNASEAASALATFVVRNVDVGVVNGSHFLHSSAIGIVPTLAEKREKIREASTRRERAARMWDAMRTAVRARPMSLVIEHKKKRKRERTMSLIVSNNPLSSDPLTPYRRHVIDGGELSAYLALHTGRLGIVRMLFTFGSGWWFWDRMIAEFRGKSFRVDARRKWMPVSNDGEVEVLALPLRYKVMPRAARVLAPAPKDGGH